MPTIELESSLDSSALRFKSKFHASQDKYVLLITSWVIICDVNSNGDEIIILMRSSDDFIASMNFPNRKTNEKLLASNSIGFASCMGSIKGNEKKLAGTLVLRISKQQQKVSN